MTWRLWRAIRQPAPIVRAFAWAVPEPPSRRVRPFRWRNVLLALLAVGVVFVLWPSLLLAGVLAVLFAPLLAVGFNGVLLGMMTTGRASAGVARLREGKSWDVVRSTPLGAWESAWAVAVMCAVHVRDTFSGRAIAWLMRVLGVLVVLLVGVSLLSLVGDEAHTVAREFAPYTAICLLLVLDYVQAQLFACLWGVLAAGMAHNSSDARLLAFIGFALARLIGYALYFGVVNTLYTIFWHTWQEDGLLIAAGLSVLLYAAANEMALQVLWRVARAWYARGYA